MTVTYLAECAEAILDAAFAALVEATTGRPAPTQVFVSHGPPAWDNCCNGGQLTIHLDALTHTPEDVTTSGIPGLGTSPQFGCSILAAPVFVVTLLRCVTGPGDTIADAIPSPAALDDDAQDLLADLWALLTEFYDRILACTLTPGLTDCRDAFIGAVAPVGPEGGCAGWEIRVTITANDSGPVGS